MKGKRLILVGHLIHMDNTRIPTKKKYQKKNFIKEHMWEDQGCDGKIRPGLH
jgi:hypothetical protein